MALRLAGERALAIQGADNQGWVREITVQDALSGLKVNQQGTGRVFDFQDGGVSKMYLPDGGNLSLVGSLVFDLANDVTITPANPASPRTLTIPDPGANDSFAFLAAAQTLTGKTLSSPTIQGTVGAGTGLTMPAFTAGGNITGGSGFEIGTSSGNLVLNPAGDVALSKRWTSSVGAYAYVAPTGKYTSLGKLVSGKFEITSGAATSFLRVTVLNGSHAAIIRIPFIVTQVTGTQAVYGDLLLLVGRFTNVNTTTDLSSHIANVTLTLAGGGVTLTASFALSALSGASTATQTVDLQITGTSSDASNVHIRFNPSMVEGNIGVSIAAL